MKVEINNHLDKLKEYSEVICGVIETIENMEEFTSNIDLALKQHFYVSVLKCKRNFKAINILINPNELQNGYVEAIPLLRVMVESYLHFCYIIDPKFKEEAIEEYNDLKKYQIEKMINNQIGYKVQLTGQADNKLLQSTRKAAKGIKLPFSDMEDLAKKTNNKQFYKHIYQKFNSYIHFNPTTYISYGSLNEDGEFIFDKYQPCLKQECEILYYSIEIMIHMIVKLLTYIGVEDVNEDLYRDINQWISLKEEYKLVMK